MSRHFPGIITLQGEIRQIALHDCLVKTPCSDLYALISTILSGMMIINKNITETCTISVKCVNVIRKKIVLKKTLNRGRTIQLVSINHFSRLRVIEEIFYFAVGSIRRENEIGIRFEKSAERRLGEKEESVWNSGRRLLNGSRFDVDGETEKQIRYGTRVERLRGGDLWGVHAR